MPYILIAIGIILAYLDYLGSANVQAAGSLLWQESFTGSDPFYKWFGAMVIIWAIGFIPDMEPIAMGMLALVLIAIVLSKKSGAAAAFESLIKGA